MNHIQSSRPLRLGVPVSIPRFSLPSPMGYRKIHAVQKEGALRAHSKGYAKDDILDLFSMSSSMFYRAKTNLASFGSVERDPATLKIRGPKRQLDRQLLEVVLQHISTNPSVSLSELSYLLASEHNTFVSISTLSKTLMNAGFTFKKLAKVASERKEEQLANFILRIGKYTPEQLVFADESSKDERTIQRSRGWAPKGQRSISTVPFLRGVRYTILPFLTMQGVLSVKVVKGSMIRTELMDYLKEDIVSTTSGRSICLCLDRHFLLQLKRMNPYPLPHSVLVMDNAQIHRSPELVDLIEEHGLFDYAQQVLSSFDTL
jgi:transposase